MPELPEVETIARSLRSCIVGATISAVEVRWPRIIDRPAPIVFCQELVGRTIAKVARRGKFLILSLPSKTLLVHLRMTGQMLFYDDSDAVQDDRHAHVRLRLASGQCLLYRDLRKFGRLYLVDDPAEVLGSLGPEPLSDGLTVEVLWKALQQRRRCIKPLLLEQDVVAGLGNIYVDESLWLAGIHPLRHANTLERQEVKRLHGAIRQVISQAIANMGTTLRDYRDPRNRPGRNQWALSVYAREGQLCHRCGSVIQKSTVNSRGTRFCPSCQPLARV